MGKEGCIGGGQSILKAVKLFPCDAMMVDTSHLGKPIKCTSSSMNSNVSCRLWVSTCHVSIGSRMVTNVPLWGEVWTMGGGLSMWEAEGIWEFSVLSTQLCFEPTNCWKKIKSMKNVYSTQKGCLTLSHGHGRRIQIHGFTSLI